MDSADSLLSEEEEVYDESLRWIHKSYTIAKSRSVELSCSSKLISNPKVNARKASRLYSALATLLYSSISISKADELEKYIEKNSTAIPKKVFDIDEWSEVIDSARRIRKSGNCLLDLSLGRTSTKLSDKALEISSMKKTAEIISRDVHDLKNDVAERFKEMNNTFKILQVQVLTSIIKPFQKLENEKERCKNEMITVSQKKDHYIELCSIEASRSKLKIELDDAISKQRESNLKTQELQCLLGDALNSLSQENFANERGRVNDIVQSVIQSFDAKMSELITLQEHEKKNRLQTEQELNIHHDLEIAALKAEYDRQIITIQKQHNKENKINEEKYNSERNTLQSCIQNIENLLQSEREQHVNDIIHERQQLSFELKMREQLVIEHKEQCQLLETRHIANTYSMTLEIERLQTFLKSANENLLQIQQTEIDRSKGENASLKANFLEKIKKVETLHDKQIIALQEQIDKLEQLRLEAVEFGKIQVEVEQNRTKELLEVEAKLRKDMEADHISQLKQLEVKNKDTLDMTSENFKSEIKRLEKLHQDAIEEGKAQLIIERSRSELQLENEVQRNKEHMLTLENSIQMKFNIIQENLQLKITNQEEEISNLHNSIKEQILKNEEKLIEERRIHAMILQSEVSKVTNLEETLHHTRDKFLEQISATLEAKLIEQPSLTVTVLKDEIARLTRLNNETLDRLKSTLEEEKTRYESQLLQQTQQHQNLCHDLKVAHETHIQTLTASKDIEIGQSLGIYLKEIELLKSTILTYEKRIIDMKNDYDNQINEETTRSKGQIITTEAAYTAKINKLKSSHEEVVVIFQSELERLENVLRESIEQSQLADERAHAAIESESLKYQENISKLILDHTLAIEEIKSTFHLANQKSDEAHAQTIENLKIDFQRQEKTYQEAIEAAKVQIAFEVTRWQELLSIERLSRITTETETSNDINRIHTLAHDSQQMIKENTTREIERLEKLLHESTENSKRQLELEIARSKEQWQALEESYKEKLATQDTTHNIAIENLQKEITRLNAQYSTMISTYENRIVEEQTRSKVLLDSEIKRYEHDRLQLITSHEKEISQLNQIYTLNMSKMEELTRVQKTSDQREISRLEQLLTSGKEHLDTTMDSYTSKIENQQKSTLITIEDYEKTDKIIREKNHNLELEINKITVEKQIFENELIELKKKYIDVEKVIDQYERALIKLYSIVSIDMKTDNDNTVKGTETGPDKDIDKDIGSSKDGDGNMMDFMSNINHIEKHLDNSRNSKKNLLKQIELLTQQSNDCFQILTTDIQLCKQSINGMKYIDKIPITTTTDDFHTLQEAVQLQNKFITYFISILKLLENSLDEKNISYDKVLKDKILLEKDSIELQEIIKRVEVQLEDASDTAVNIGEERDRLRKEFSSTKLQLEENVAAKTQLEVEVKTLKSSKKTLEVQYNDEVRIRKELESENLYWFTALEDGYNEDRKKFSNQIKTLSENSKILTAQLRASEERVLEGLEALAIARKHVEELQVQLEEREKQVHNLLQFGDLSVDDIHTNIAVVKIQSCARGFLVRRRLSGGSGARRPLRRPASQRPNAEGLVAASGTTSGETGWYYQGTALFYYYIDKEIYFRLCGPVSNKEYRQALEEFKTLSTTLNAPLESIVIDRIALIAAVHQIDNLIKEESSIWTKIEHVRGEVEKDFLNTKKKYEDEIKKLKEKAALGLPLHITDEDDNVNGDGSSSRSPRGGGGSGSGGGISGMKANFQSRMKDIFGGINKKSNKVYSSNIET